MDWFKHDSNANMDDKLQLVLMDYGLEGYGLYWYCVELIVGRISSENITFELKHDARVIARYTGSTTQKVEEMMSRFIELGLFENRDGAITCMKVAKRLMSSATSNPAMRQIISNINQNKNLVAESCHRHDDDMKEEIRLDKIRLDKIKPLGANRATQLPKGFAPSDGHRMLASESGIQLDREFIKFTDYCVANGKTYKDWDAALRNWIRNASSFARSKPQSPGLRTSFADVDYGKSGKI